MRPKLLIVLFGAAAFFCAFFGATAMAKADEPVVSAVATATPASSIAPRANLAAPGTYAARFGAPLCDERGASTYAAEPRPAPVDSGEVAPAAEDTCSSSLGAQLSAATDAHPAQQDDLHRTPPVARDLAILPGVVDLPPCIELVAVLERETIEGARDGFAPHDNPPPRPIPWRT
jgi:hypothetical protein